MRIIEYSWIWDWCREVGAQLEEKPLSSPRLLDDPALVHRTKLVFAWRGPTGAEPAIADELLKASGSWDEALLWITGWGVWPSSEDWPRYYALRAQYGQRLSIDDAPGHVFSSDEKDQRREVLLQVLENGWDAVVLFSGDNRLVSPRIRLSHDGWLVVESRDPVSLPPLQALR